MNTTYPKPKKVSVKWLTKRLDCTANGRKICQGLCCKQPNMHAWYLKDEIDKVPKEYRKYLVWVEKEGMYRVKKQEDGRTCAFIDLCYENPEIKPIFCWLFPLKIDKNGNLVLHRWAPMKCPCYGKGEELWLIMKDSIIKAWGKEFYEKEVVAKVKKYKEEKQKQVHIWDLVK